MTVLLVDLSDLIKPLLLWLLLTVVYAVALFVVKDFEVTSLLYHIGLVLIAVYFARNFAGLGLKVGNYQRGFLLCAGFSAFLVVRTFLYGFSNFDPELNIATFTLVFFAPATEELFWRGLILQRMLTRKTDVFGTIFANSGFFALMHVPRIIFLNENALSLVSIFVFGVIFSGIYYLSKSVYYSTIAHSLTNIFTLFG